MNPLMIEAETQTQHLGTEGVHYRTPRAEDGIAVWQLVREAGTLELNTAYFYLIFCSDFQDTSLVAEHDGQIIGAILGYRPPKSPDTIFCWQVGVLPSWRGKGLASRMLKAWSDHARDDSIQYVTATVAQDNQASDRLFRRFARETGVSCEVSPHFTADLLPPDHCPEPIYRIGPLTPTTTASAVL